MIETVLKPFMKEKRGSLNGPNRDRDRNLDDPIIDVFDIHYLLQLWPLKFG
jgi:hypothetical protein